MDLSGFHQSRDGMEIPRILDNSGTNKVHRNCSTNSRNDVESGGNDCNLQTEKTEMNITQGNSDSQFPAGMLERLNSRLVLDGPARKTAMDLSFHVNRNDSGKTIFDDADYFARNYMYKLMPITLEVVNETIIHIEHNYCNFASSPDVSTDENLNKTTHGEAEERNYKRRKSKSGECLFPSEFGRGEESDGSSVTLKEGLGTNAKLEEEYSMPIQPLDLSLPVFHEQKTDNMLKEKQSNIPKMKSESRSTPDPKQFDMCESNKENVTTARKIEVTISRPGQKEYYRPCEVFLNDVARISPDLVKNDCYEIDIIDRTGQDLEKEKCRTYYIVSESTWQTFENSTERIILTNDLNIGEPIQNNEKFEKPTYLIFDQFSLTESLVKICENKGGSFEYTCLKESLPKAQDARREVQDCGSELPVGGVNSEEESSSDASKKHLTEANNKRNLFAAGDVRTEPDSTIASKVAAEKPEEQRLETEEEVCDNPAEKAEESKQSEPQLPIESNRDDGIHEEGNQHVDAVKSEPESERNVQFTAGERDRTDDSVGNKRKAKRAAAEAPAKGAKRKRTVAASEAKKESASTSSKRVTRSSAALTEKVPRESETREGKRSKGRPKTKVEPRLDKEEDPKTKKAMRRKSKEKKESSSVKAINGGGREGGRKRRVADVEPLNGENVRETRSTTRKKAVKNTIMTRARKMENKVPRKFY